MQRALDNVVPRIEISYGLEFEKFEKHRYIHVVGSTDTDDARGDCKIAIGSFNTPSLREIAGRRFVLKIELMEVREQAEAMRGHRGLP